MAISRFLLLSAVSASFCLCAQNSSKPAQGAIPNPSAAAPSKKVIRKAEAADSTAVANGSNEVVATNFSVGANSCANFDSQLTYTGARTAYLAIFAQGVDLTATRLVPFFGVDMAPFLSATTQLKGSDFPFTDGGGGEVKVGGAFLRIGVCNDSSNAVNYSQLTVYIPR